MSEKNPVTSDEPQNERVGVNRSEMVDAILGILGSDGTLAFWMMLKSIPREDCADASVLRQFKETYLHETSDKRLVLIVMSFLKQLESDPSAPVLNRFFTAMREHTTFGFINQYADVLKGVNEPARQKILEAAKTIRSLFDGTLVQIKISDISVN